LFSNYLALVPIIFVGKIEVQKIEKHTVTKQICLLKQNQKPTMIPIPMKRARKHSEIHLTKNDREALETHFQVQTLIEFFFLS